MSSYNQIIAGRTVMLNKKYLISACFTMLSILSNSAFSATVSAEICMAATVMEQSPYEVIGDSGGVYTCASISGSAVSSSPGETVIFSDFYEDFSFLAGGGNSTGITVDYSILFDWTYSITTTLVNANETAFALVRADIFGLEFTSGSGSGSRVITSSIEDGMFVDYGGTFYAEGYASSYSPIPLPGAGWLFGAGIFSFFSIAGRRQSTRQQATVIKLNPAVM